MKITLLGALTVVAAVVLLILVGHQIEHKLNEGKRKDGKPQREQRKSPKDETDPTGLH